MGVELFLDIQYQLKIEFIENRIRMSFVSVDQMGQFTEGVSQQEKDFVKTADFKMKMEKMMNEISASLVNYLMK